MPDAVEPVQPALELAAAAFALATANPPYLFDLPPAEGRKAVNDVQSGEIEKPRIYEEWITVSGGPTGSVRADRQSRRRRGHPAGDPPNPRCGLGLRQRPRPRPPGARTRRWSGRRRGLPRVRPVARSPLPGRHRSMRDIWPARPTTRLQTRAGPYHSMSGMRVHRSPADQGGGPHLADHGRRHGTGAFRFPPLSSPRPSRTTVQVNEKQ